MNLRDLSLNIIIIYHIEQLSLNQLFYVFCEDGEKG